MGHATYERHLGDADRGLIEMACTAGIIRNLSRGEGIQGEVMQGFPAKGVTPVKFSYEILKQLQKVTNVVLKEEADKDPDFARIWQSQKKFQATYRNWKSFAYLPRDF